MSLQYDFHTHTRYSDGTLSPAQLVRAAAGAGVRALAITDHDVTDALAEAAPIAKDCGLQLVPGVEISATWSNKTIHVLGLGIDPAHSALQAGLARLRELRDARAEDMGARLAKHGIANALAGARALAAGPIISRTHFAHFLVKAGHVRELRQAFKQFLAKGKPGYVSQAWAGIDEAVSWIRAAGGRAVIAHPGRYDLGTTALGRLFEDFRAAGGEGIEVISGSHSRDDYHRFAHFAREFGFLASAGSDYHGPENVWLHLGQLPDFPSPCKPVWHDWNL